MSNGNLVVALDVAPGSLAPYESNNLHSHAVIWPTCEPLFDVREFNARTGVAEMKSLLAAIPPAQQDLDYTFALRQGVLFHDKTDFTSDAVARNLEYAKGLRSFRGRILGDLIGDVRPAGNSVTISLNYAKVDLLFLALMNSPAALGKRTSGTGPFMLDPSGNPLVLTRNPNYRDGAPTPGSIGSITFRPLPPEAAIAELINQEVHFVRAVYPDGLSRVRDNREIATERFNPRGTYYLGFHLKSREFARRSVRQAFRQAIDFGNIQQYAGLDPAVGLLPPTVEAYDRALPRPPRNRSGAETVLKPDFRDSEVDLLINGHSYYARRLAHRIQADLEGIVRLKLVEHTGSNALLSEIEKRRKGDKAYLFIYNWYSILPAAEVFLRPLFESQWPDNLTGYGEFRSAETNYAGFADALRAARTERSQDRIEDRIEARIRHYRQAHQILIDDAPAIFLGHPGVRYSARRASVSGLASKDLNVQSFPVDRYHGVGVR